MSTYTPSGFNWADAVQPLEERRQRQQAWVVASFAEYLAEDVHGHPERAPEAIASLAEWCEDDHELMVQARTEVLRHRRRKPVDAFENNREAVELLELVASA
jgi:hypothetical protein